MRRTVIYLVLHVVLSYGSERPKCPESQLLMEQKYCDNHTSTLTTHTSYENLTDVNLSKGCDVEIHSEVGNNGTIYLECEIEDINCEKDTHRPSTRQVFMVECNDEPLNLYSFRKEEKKTEEEEKKVEEDKKKDLTVPILAGTSAAAMGTVGTGFLIYKLKTIIQSGTYMFPGV